MLSVWEERLYGEHANVHQSHSQNDSGDLRGVAGGDGELGCLCGKAGTSHLCDGSAHSSGCVVNGSIIISVHAPSQHTLMWVSWQEIYGSAKNDIFHRPPRIMRKV